MSVEEHAVRCVLVPKTVAMAAVAMAAIAMAAVAVNVVKGEAQLSKLHIVFIIVALLLSLLLFGQSLFSLHLMLYAWEYPERLEAGHGPTQWVAPQSSFCVLLPARHEAAVIAATIRQLQDVHYPPHLIEIIVICHADDSATITAAQGARAAEQVAPPPMPAVGISALTVPGRGDATAVAVTGQGAVCDVPQLPSVRVQTFATGPINKPRALNQGLSCASSDVVVVFDAEDDIGKDLFNVVNTLFAQEAWGIVQGGVHLVNFADHWFAIHNVLEYYFWFKSRLHLHAAVGMIPLGGNTVFIRRELLEKVGGWDENCLTEDADLGLRLSVLGERIGVFYDAQHATREETPESVGAFIRQRTRWHQGFLQILGKGDWRKLPHCKQRLLGLYTLAHPLFQVLTALLWPMAFLVFRLKLPLLVTIGLFLPIYALVFQCSVSLIGAWVFMREYGVKFSWRWPLHIVVTFLPYQLLISVSAVRAVWRQLTSQNNWEKTEHHGAHRDPIAL